MEAFKDKECVVCGAATTKSCSACKKLFFCSAEHQKLVSLEKSGAVGGLRLSLTLFAALLQLWVTHKHLCGKQGYTPPPFTKDEVARAVAHPGKL
jgi:hypothetical protein